ncbi:MAG: undecaprenyl-diphosphate phosphatase [Prevotellaceae bacterium]|jgi:undecaprenyl-diphosphatase|nr:undecaprenyl-diphosphate phosphatase [Prevotellaceae bacterium]
MTIFEAIVLAVVEGITEFLPVSSTGHMIIAGKLLNIENDDFVKTYEVVIQFGAILSVTVLYWRRFLQNIDFYIKLIIAVIPALLIGFLLNDQIDRLLERVDVVAIMLVIGGILMLFVDKWFGKPASDQTVTRRKAFIIGLAQCVAMIPGVSRSMASIVGGMAQKLDRRTAAEFSFFLAVPTMAAAAGYKVLKMFIDPNTATVNMLKDNISLLIIGNVVAFVVAMLAIKGFISLLSKYGFKSFGIYRIIVGTTILTLLLCGVNLQII